MSKPLKLSHDRSGLLFVRFVEQMPWVYDLYDRPTFLWMSSYQHYLMVWANVLLPLFGVLQAYNISKPSVNNCKLFLNYFNLKRIWQLFFTKKNAVEPSAAKFKVYITNCKKWSNALNWLSRNSPEKNSSKSHLILSWRLLFAREPHNGRIQCLPLKDRDHDPKRSRFRPWKEEWAVKHLGPHVQNLA